MFVQVFEGATADAEAVGRLMEKWRDDLRSSSPGFLGSTSGVSPSGHAIALVRFQNADFARRNSERPAQGVWWAEFEKTFSSEPAFHESEDVVFFGPGGSDDAGFVQVIRGASTDRDTLDSIDERLYMLAAEERPDVLGGYRIWHHGNRFIEAVYFTSEAAARAGEAAELSPGIQSLINEASGLMVDVHYDDLVSPVLFSA